MILFSGELQLRPESSSSLAREQKMRTYIHGTRRMSQKVHHIYVSHSFSQTNLRNKVDDNLVEVVPIAFGSRIMYTT